MKNQEKDLKNENQLQNGDTNDNFDFSFIKSIRKIRNLLHLCKKLIQSRCLKGNLHIVQEFQEDNILF